MTNQEYSTLFTQNYNKLFKFAKKLTRSEADAKDLLQETAMKAFTNRNQLDNSAKFKSWISTVLYNTYISSFNKKKRRRNLMATNGASKELFFNVSSTSNGAVANLAVEDIEKVTSNIGSKSMSTFKLYYKGYSYQEIADKLDISIGTVKSRINFCRTKMKKLLVKSEIAA